MSMGMREYARHRKAAGLKGGTLRAVQKAVLSGRIDAADGKRIDAADADARWAATTDQALQRGVLAGAPSGAPAAPVPEIILPLIDGVVAGSSAGLSPGLDWRAGGWDGPLPPAPPFSERVAKAMTDNLVDGESFMAWKTREQRANALAAERELAKEGRELLAAADVEKAFVSMGRVYAQGREALPAQLAPQLVGLTDLGEIERRVRAVMRVTDQRIADEIRSQYAEVVDGVSAAC
jgi:hypothetical protein